MNTPEIETAFVQIINGAFSYMEFEKLNVVSEYAYEVAYAIESNIVERKHFEMVKVINDFVIIGANVGGVDITDTIPCEGCGIYPVEVIHESMRMHQTEKIVFANRNLFRLCYSCFIANLNHSYRIAEPNGDIAYDIINNGRVDINTGLCTPTKENAVNQFIATVEHIAKCDRCSKDTEITTGLPQILDADERTVRLSEIETLRQIISIRIGEIHNDDA